MALNINQRLNGLHSLSYMGDNAVQPPDFVTKSRPPTPNDSKNFALGDIWLDTTGYPVTLPGSENVYMLVALVGNQATWVNFAGGSSLEKLTGNSGGPVSGDVNDNINILGDGTTINIVGTPINNTLTVSAIGTGLVSTLTGDTGSAVVPTAGNIDVIAGLSSNNCGSTVGFFGSASTLLLGVTDIDGNTIIGELAGNSSITGANNTCLGITSGASLTSGSTSVFIGLNSGALVTSGSNLILLGASSGSAYTSSESSNIMIGNGGVISESNTIRIGKQGSSLGQQNRAFVAGVYGVTPAVNDSFNVVIDSNGQLGTHSAITSSSFLAFNSSNVLNQTGNAANVTVTFDTEIFDTNGDYDNTTNIFTAPATGLYQFNASVTVTDLSSAMTTGLWSFVVVGTGISIGTWSTIKENAYATRGLDDDHWRLNGTISLFLNVGDTVKVVLKVDGGAGDTATIAGAAVSPYLTWISGYRIG